MLNKYKKSLKTKQISALTKTLSGFNNMNYHTNRTNESYTEQCDYCTLPGCTLPNSEETANHIITKCLKFIRLREELFDKDTMETKDICQSIDKKRSITRIIEYMQKTKTLEKTPRITKRNRSPNRLYKRRRVL